MPTFEIHLTTKGPNDVVVISEQVAEKIHDSGVQEGIGLVFNPGATGAITTIEPERGAVNDFRRLLEQLVPQNADYEHNLAYGDGNGFSHVRAALIGPSLSFPIVDGKPVLGRWQDIIFVECDNRPRDRHIVLNVVEG